MNELRREIDRMLSEIPITYGGGCSVDKAYAMAWMIRRYQLRTTLDIGVYMGRSLFPQAIAHRRCTGGVAYGVDPWAAAAAEQRDMPEYKELLERFVRETDFEAVYGEVERLRNKWSLEKHCVLIRETSEAAAQYFAERDIEFDLIHIDGNHDTKMVSRDVELYVPRLREGGFLFMDDVTWPSVRPAYERVCASLQHVYERVKRSRGDDYAVFRRSRSKLRLAALRTAFHLQVHSYR